VLLVGIAVEGGGEGVGVRPRQDAQREQAIGMGGGDRPGDLTAPVDAGEMEARAGAGDGFGDFDHVGGQSVDRVVGEVGRVGTGARRIAALVGRDGAETGVGQGRELVSPGVARLRKAVQQQDQRAVGRAGDPAVEHQAGAGCQLRYVHTATVTAVPPRPYRDRRLAGMALIGSRSRSVLISRPV